MERKKKKYRRVPGRSRKSYFAVYADRYRLWLAEDHLMMVRMSAYKERYQRFYFKDIQALVLNRTDSGRRLNKFLFVLALWLLGMAALTWLGLPTSVAFFFAAMAALSLILLALNALYGPTCRCRLHTAVQAQDLVPLGRVRPARKALSIMKPLIEEAQGRLSPKELDASSEEVVEVRASAHDLSRRSRSHEPVPEEGPATLDVPEEPGEETEL
jgi:hypothetical protein